MIVRPATDRDIPAIVHLLELLFSIEADFSFVQEKQQKGVEILLSDINACALVAALQGKVRCSKVLWLARSDRTPDVALTGYVAGCWDDHRSKAHLYR